jgi:hypothetical protein
MKYAVHWYLNYKCRIFGCMYVLSAIGMNELHFSYRHQLDFSFLRSLLFIYCPSFCLYIYQKLQRRNYVRWNSYGPWLFCGLVSLPLLQFVCFTTTASNPQLSWIHTIHVRWSSYVRDCLFYYHLSNEVIVSCGCEPVFVCRGGHLVAFLYMLLFSIGYICYSHEKSILFMLKYW